MKQQKKKEKLSLPMFILLGIVLFIIIKFWQIVLIVNAAALLLFIVIMVVNKGLRSKVMAFIKNKIRGDKDNGNNLLKK